MSEPISSAELRHEMREELKELRARLATAEAERDAAVALLAEITPSRLIGESHKPYPEGKTTVLMSWDWLRRVRAISRGDHLPSAGDAGERIDSAS